MPPDRRKTLLVVDSDDEIRESLTAALRRDYRVLRAATGEAALQMMQKEDVDLMLLEVHLPGISGFEVLKIAQENYPYVEIIVISKTKELDTAIEAMRHGAYHYISKDFDIESIRTLFANAGERQDLSRDVMRLKEEVAEQNEREFVVGPEPQHARRRGAGAEGRQDLGDGARPRRERHRQGTARADDSSRVRAADAHRSWR